MSPLLIAQIEPPQAPGGGDYYYRTYAPGRAMAEAENVYVINLTAEHRLREEIVGAADVLILKNICDPDFLPDIQKRRVRGQATFYEIADDLKAIPPWNPVHFFYQNIENQRLFQSLARACDGLQFTCRRLQELYGYLNVRNEVFPNQMLEELPAKTRIKEQRIAIGWGGSHGHLEDMAEVAGSLIRWLGARPEATLHIMGSEPIRELFAALPDVQKRYTRPGSIAAYYRFLTQIDIGLIPMRDTAFNRSRSDIKFVEYAAAGAAAVIRKLDPYDESAVHEENAFVFENEEQMIAGLERLCQDRTFWERLTAQARTYVRRHRRQRDHVPERLAFYRPAPSVTAKTDCAGDWFMKWSRVPGAVVQGRHLQLESTRFEQLVYDGLVALQVRRESERAGRLFAEAGILEPRQYLPYLYGAECAADPAVSLKKALALKPDSIKSWIALGEQMVRISKIKEAMQAFESAAVLFPGYEVPYLRAAELLERIGQKGEARRLQDRAQALIDRLSVKSEM